MENPIPNVFNTLVIIIGDSASNRLDLDLRTLQAKGRVPGTGGGCTGGSSGCAFTARVFASGRGNFPQSTPQRQVFVVQTRPAKPEESYVLTFQDTTDDAGTTMGMDNALAFLNSLDPAMLWDKYVLVMDERLAATCP